MTFVNFAVARKGAERVATSVNFPPRTGSMKTAAFMDHAASSAPAGRGRAEPPRRSLVMPASEDRHRKAFAMLLRLLVTGAIAAIALPRLKRAYEDGTLRKGADSLRARAGKLGETLGAGRDALAEQLAPARALVAEKLAAHGGQTPQQMQDNPSRRPKANPWPVDRRALPRG